MIDTAEQTYAICEWCGQEMEGGTACTYPTYLFLHKLDMWGVPKELSRIPYGDEREGWGEFPDVPTPDLGAHFRLCHDCNVAPGQLHHPGCDMEHCPDCGEQMLQCEDAEQEPRSTINAKGSGE